MIIYSDGDYELSPAYMMEQCKIRCGGGNPNVKRDAEILYRAWVSAIEDLLPPWKSYNPPTGAISIDTEKRDELEPGWEPSYMGDLTEASWQSALAATDL